MDERVYGVKFRPSRKVLAIKGLQKCCKNFGNRVFLARVCDGASTGKACLAGAEALDPPATGREALDLARVEYVSGRLRRLGERAPGRDLPAGVEYLRPRTHDPE